MDAKTREMKRGGTAVAAVAAGGERGTLSLAIGSHHQVTARILLLLVAHVGEWRGRGRRRRRRGQYTTGETAPWSYPDKDEKYADKITARTKNNNREQASIISGNVGVVAPSPVDIEKDAWKKTWGERHQSQKRRWKKRK